MPSPTSGDLHIDYALTDLSVAYFQENPPISDLMFPRVTVDHRSNKYFLWNKGDFWRDDAALHAPGDDYETTKLSLDSNQTYFCDEYGIEYPLADQILANEDAAVDLAQTATRVVTSRLQTRKDRAFANDFLKTTVWGTDITGVASAPTSGQTLQWNDATSDPASDLQTALDTIMQATGDIPNLTYRLLIGATVRAALVNHPDAIDRIKYTERADVKAVDGVLGAWLGVDDLVVARRMYTTSAEGATDAFARIVGKVALLVAVPTSPGLNIPSAGYTFQWNEAGRGPMYVERYRWEKTKSDIVRGITYFDQKAVATSLGYFFTSVVA